MRGIATSLLLLASLLGQATASPTKVIKMEQRADGSVVELEERLISVTVSAPAGSIVGKQNPLFQTEHFNGIPFAEPPVGDLRLRGPVRKKDQLTSFDASGISPACPQKVGDSDSNGLLDQVTSLLTESPLFKKVLNVQEDCLNLNVIRPTNFGAGANLPVLFWIYGGGFDLGWNSMYDAAAFVSTAAKKGKPFVFVAVNYRVAGWGFLPGKEVLADDAANLGLRDQRMGLEWVADNIRSFGGDPDKVTIWGESAGSISVWAQMAYMDGNNLYKNKPLFRGGIMNSGSVVPADPIDDWKGQSIYDGVVKAAGCEGENSLDCLRKLSLEDFTYAANTSPSLLSYNSVAISFLPRPDGKYVTRSFLDSLKENKYAAVPFIIGDQEDEGTIFSLFQANTTSTTEGLVHYLQTVFFQNVTTEVLTELVNLYPRSPTAGSPFRTSIFNEIYPGFKRLSAILGDMVFTIARRLHLRLHYQNNPSVKAWSYLASYDYGTPIIGTFHASDLLQVFYGVLPNYASNGIQSYYANFIYNLDPNDDSGGTPTGTGSKVRDYWQPWTGETRMLKQFYAWSFNDLKDDFRKGAEDFLYKYAGSVIKL